MIMLTFPDVKNFMQKLLYEKETVFDAFLLSEATIKMDATFIIDGHINKDFYSTEEIEEAERLHAEKNQHFDTEMVRWGKIKSHMLSMISGKKTPLSFSIVFYLSKENTEKLLSNTPYEANAIKPDKLMLRINYENSILSAVTGTAYKAFSLNKTYDTAWDEMVCKFFKAQQIEFEMQ